MKYSVLTIALLAFTGVTQAADCKAVFGDGKQEFIVGCMSGSSIKLLYSI